MSSDSSHDFCNGRKIDVIEMPSSYSRKLFYENKCQVRGEERKSMSVCVCMRERERDKESVDRMEADK